MPICMVTRSKRVIEKFKDIMTLFCKATGMTINLQKSTISMWGFLSKRRSCFTNVPLPTGRLRARLEILRFLPKTKYVQKRRLVMVEGQSGKKA
jgi:hypothetical protein